MNNHQRRLIIGFIIDVLVLVALFLLLEKSAVVITAFCFSLLAPVMLFGTLWLVASGTKSKYITNAAFPIQAYTYGVLNLVICAVFVLLDRTGVWSISAGWFSFVHILLIAWFAWRFLAMDSGQEEIERVERNVNLMVTNWKMIGADVETIKREAPESCRKDAIRYADPMTCPELEPLDQSIKDHVFQLEQTVREGKLDEVSPLCMRIQRLIRDRSTKAKILK